MIKKALSMNVNDKIIDFSDKILITGANGFIGSCLVKTLLEYGFCNLVCCVRPTSDLTELRRVINCYPSDNTQIYTVDLLSGQECDRLAEGVHVIYHLAAAMRDTSFESSYINNIETTRNILNATIKAKSLQRFVNMSSLRVYSNTRLKHGELLDETCDIESDLDNRADAYCAAKVKQEELVTEFCKRHELSYVTLRPGIVYGPGSKGIHRMVGRMRGKGKWGLFIHLGGSNVLPLSYVENCADAIVLAGIKEGVDGEIFNVVDDDLPTSRTFLKLYKQNVRRFKSIYIPYRIFYIFCYLWEKYSKLSKMRLPPTFNRKKCSAAWKGNQYSNAKLKILLGWKPKINFSEALKNYFEFQKLEK